MKRKADLISNELGDLMESLDGAPPRLPALALGHVLDFLPYAHARSALLAGKYMAVEAAKHVQTLNIMRAGEMYVPAARRFASVREINILCLIAPLRRDPGRGYLFSPSASLEAATMAPPFISTFCNLKHVYFGGWTQELTHRATPRAGVFRRHEYDCRCEPVGGSNHHVVFKALLFSLLGFFQVGMISQDVEMEGILRPYQSYCHDWMLNMRLFRGTTNVDSHCFLCREIMRFFPLSSTAPFAKRGDTPSYITATCIPLSDRLDITKRREGGSEALVKLGIRRTKPRRCNAT